MWKATLINFSCIISLFCSVEGGFTSDDENIQITSYKILRKRSLISEKALSLQVADEFGSQYFEEDRIYWNRILDGNSFPAVDRCDVDVGFDIGCYLASDPSISCKEYMELIGTDSSKYCSVPIVYDFSILNKGTLTDKIIKVKTAVNGQRPFDYIEDSIPKVKKSLASGSQLIASRRMLFNFCDLYEDDMNIEVGVQCEEGDPKMLYRTLSLSEIAEPPLCNAKVDLSVAPQAPTNRCTHRPRYFDLLFTGELCEQVKSQKSSCIDVGDISKYSQAYIKVRRSKNNKVYFSGYVNFGDIFTFDVEDKKDSKLYVFIYDKKRGKVIQKFGFHPSCSKDTDTNNVYGAITIVGMRDEKRNVLSVQSLDPPQFTVTYQVTNNESRVMALENVRLTIDQSHLYDLYSKTREWTSRVSPLSVIYNSTVVSFENSSPSCHEMTLTLNYVILPHSNIKKCSVWTSKTFYDPFKTSEYGKYRGKGKAAVSRCTRKGSRLHPKNSKGKGDGSVRNSKGKKGRIAKTKGSKSRSNSL